MSKRPIIGVLGNRIPNEGRLFHGMERDYVNHDYVEAIEHCGGDPCIIPVTDTSDTMIRLLDIVDGILLTGGYDIHPSYYKEDPLPSLEYTDQHIDAMQIAFAQEVFQRKIPVLAICRGAQLVNVMAGGTLFQDTKMFSGQTLQHMQNAKRGEAAHSLSIKKGSRLHAIFGKQVRVNSFHHVCIHDVGKNLLITATASDGIPEAIESSDPDYFALGVQWHPEMMFTTTKTMRPLFSAFIEASSLRVP